MIRTRVLLSLLISLAILAGCAQNPRQVGHSLTVCCPGDYGRYEQFSVEAVELPYFLRDYMVDEFTRAFEEKGLVRDDRINDVKVTLRYHHVNLKPEQEDIDPFVRMEGMNAELSYVANVLVEMRETATDKLVWAGRIHRIHHVSPGEYMHEDSARGEILMAFRDLLANYPRLP
jgi:hypothetical protein